MELLLARVAEEYRSSSFAPRALNRLGNLYLDSGRADRAAHVFGTILAEYPDTDLDRALLQAKYAFAATLCVRGAASSAQRRPAGPKSEDGRTRTAGGTSMRMPLSSSSFGLHSSVLPSDRALRAIEVLAKSFGSSTFTVAGRKWRGASYATELRSRIGLKGRGRRARPSAKPAREPSPMTSRYEVRFPVSPAERLAVPRITDAAYRPVATHGAVAGPLDRRVILFHTLEEAFAVDLGTGALRWRSGLFFEHLRRGAGSPEFGGVPETSPAVADGRVYVRALRRSVRGRPGGRAVPGESTFVIEARDCGTGDLLWSTGAIPELARLSAVSSPAAADGAVFAVFRDRGENQRLHGAAFDAGTGELLWRKRCVDGFAGISFADQRNVYLGDHMAAPSVADGDVYVATDMGAVMALSSATGSIRWIAQYPRAVLDHKASGPVRARLISRAAPRVVVGARCLYVLPRDSMALLCISRPNGDILWRKDLVDCQSPVGFVGPEGVTAGRIAGRVGGRGKGRTTPTDSGRLVIQGRGVTSLDAGTGAAEWRWLPGAEDGSVHGLAALVSRADGEAGGTVYVPTERGIRRLRLEDGREAGFSPWEEMGVGRPVGNLIVLDDAAPGGSGRSWSSGRQGDPTGRAIVGFDLGRLVRIETAARLPVASSPKSARRPAGGRDRIVEIPDLTGMAERDVPLRTSGLARAELDAPIFVRWRVGGGAGRILASPGADELYLLVGQSIVRVRLDENRISWRAPAASDVKKIRVAGDVVLLIYDGFLSALDRDTGVPLWTSVERPKGVSLSEEALVILTDEGQLTVLNPTDGKVVSKPKVGRGALAARALGSEVFVLLADRKNLWAKAFNSKTGEELWRHDFEIGRSDKTKIAAVRGTDVYIYSNKRLLCFDAAKREIVFNEPLDPKGDPGFRFEGGYLVAASYQSWSARTTFLIDPATGKLLFRKKHRRGQPLRFWPGRAVLSMLDQDSKTVCVTVPRLVGPADQGAVADPAGGPEADELWAVKERGWYERFFGGQLTAPEGPGPKGLAVPGGRSWKYWVQPYGRDGRLHCRLFDAQTGSVEEDFIVPGRVRDRDPGLIYRGGLLIYGTEQGVYALGGLPPAPRGKDPLAEAVREVARAATGRSLREREGSSEFLARYARDAYGVFLASKPIRVDGRADDWEDVEAIEIGCELTEPIHLRAESFGGEARSVGLRRAQSSRTSGRPDGAARLRRTGPQDCSVRARLAWDRKYVYVGVEVTDDRLVAPAPGADLSTGDSVIIGFDPEPGSAEEPDDNDVILQMALVGGRARLVQLHGRDIQRLAVQEDDRGEGRTLVRISGAARLGSRRGGQAPKFTRRGGSASGNGLFYELALPWGALRTAADERPGKKPAMRLGLAVLDWDGTRPDGALEWGYGLVRGLRPCLFGDISFVDFSPERVARYHRFIDCLPSHGMSWRFLGRIGAAAASSGGEEAAGAVYEEFVRKRPRSALAPRALAELVRLYSRIDPVAAREGPVGRVPWSPGRRGIEAKVAALAARAKVPARAIGEALGPGEWSGGLGGAVRQWVYLDPEETPVEIMLEFKTERDGLRRCFWGADMIHWGKPNTEERWPMGDLPPAGRWVQVTVPVGALRLEGHSVTEIEFSVHAGRAYWDLTEYVADGDVKVLLDDELAKGGRFRGNGAGKWVDGPVKSGRRAHTNGTAGARSSTRSHATVVRFKVDPAAGEAKEPTKAELEKYVRAAGILPDTEEAITLLQRAEKMYDDLKDPKRAESVAEMYAAFLRESPDTPRAHEVLTRVRRILERALPKDAVARCERIMDEARLPRAQRRLFYSQYATGIRRWEILGYFDAGGIEAGIEKALPPERFPVNLNSVHTRSVGTFGRPGGAARADLKGQAVPGGAKLSWREIATANGIVDLKAHLGGVPDEAGWPVAYLYTRIESPRRQKVSLIVKVRGFLAAWVGGKPAAVGKRGGRVVSGRFDRGEEFPFPVTLKKGVNDVLLKISERRGAARVFCRVADLNGRPVGDVPGGLACRLPPRLLGVLAYQERPGPRRGGQASGLPAAAGERAAETKAFFSRPVDPVSAGNTLNYSVDKGVQVKSARVDADGRTVVLTTSELSPDTTYTLSVANVTDTMTPPNAVEPGTRMRFSRTLRGAGVGLRAEHFEGQDFAKLKLTRIDATVNFDWGEGSPDPAVPADGFCVRWTGRVEPLATGRYSFHAVTDDGVRLWVDGRLIIDDWVGRSATESTGHVELEGGRLHPIKMEYYEGPGAAVAKLLWTDPVRGKEVVPASQLYP